jgi:hypothetical protein
MDASQHLFAKNQCDRRNLCDFLMCHAGLKCTEISKCDHGHEGEALYWAARERVHARGIEARIRNLRPEQGPTVQGKAITENGDVTLRRDNNPGKNDDDGSASVLIFNQLMERKWKRRPDTFKKKAQVHRELVSPGLLLWSG